MEEHQIESISPNPAAFNAGKALSTKTKWSFFAKSDRAIWGEIQGSGKTPYRTQVDLATVTYKCSCPSRQFPCKHNIGLMLIYAKTPGDFTFNNEEPEWVKSWIDKKQIRVEKKDSEVERSSEEQEKLDKAKEKTQAERFEMVKAGVAELELWLKDIIRIGIIELPQKPTTEFEKVAARMVDSKAPGLAGWVKSLGKLNYNRPTEWQNDALTIIAKLYLLVSTFNNYENLSPIWQITVKNLVGWNQSTKELLADNDVESVKDRWLVVGQNTETTDDITTQRNWLIGCNTNQKALVLHFATKFSSIENPILSGSIVHAELVFFPSVLPYRAAIKMQRSIENELERIPEGFDSWNLVYEYRTEQLKCNPWVSETLIILNNSRIAMQENKWVIIDNEQNIADVNSDYEIKKIMKWLAISGNRQLKVACLMHINSVVPLGIFQDKQYIIL